MDDARARNELLRPAVDALRAALRRMDAKDVPARLRGLSDSSDRKLPPPLLARAVNELDGSEWLRAETANEIDLDEGTAAQLFIERPDGWESRLEELIEQSAEDRRRRRSSRQDEKRAAAEVKVVQLESELRAARTAVTEAEKRGVERQQAKLDAARRAQKQAARQVREANRLRAAADERVGELEALLADAEARVESHRQMLEKERRAASESPTADGGRGWFPSDPLGMAAELDRIVTATHQRPADPSSPMVAAGPGPKLPDGVRPDRAEAITALLKQPVTWLVDGWNLAFQLAPEPDAVTRNRVLTAVGRLVRLSLPATMGVVVFDSSVEEFSAPADRRVRLVFAPSADEWIIETAGPGTVVVSSDRRVREAAQKAGAIGLWSEALKAWITAGRSD